MYIDTFIQVVRFFLVYVLGFVWLAIAVSAMVIDLKNFIKYLISRIK